MIESMIKFKMAIISVDVVRRIIKDVSCGNGNNDFIPRPHANFKEIEDYLKKYGYGDHFPNQDFQETYIDPFVHSYLFWKHMKKGWTS